MVESYAHAYFNGIAYAIMTDIFDRDDFKALESVNQKQVFELIRDKMLQFIIGNQIEQITRLAKIGYSNADIAVAMEIPESFVRHLRYGI